MVTAVQVAADLADPQGGPASCTAEEIVRHAVGGIAGELREAPGRLSVDQVYRRTIKDGRTRLKVARGHRC